MRCILCENLSLTHICPSCQKAFLTPSIHKRKIFNGIEVISFYKYKNIKALLHTKHTDLGFYIYKILAQNSFLKFSMNFKFDTILNSIPIDDTTTTGYSHTAILNKSLKSKSIKPIFNALRAENSISYSGKSRAFRLSNPRDFKLKKDCTNNVILVDDIITTGSTLTQAVQALQKNKKEVLFCLTLADARD